MGAVMGAKKLKAIVVRGRRAPEVAEKERIKELARWMGEHFKERTVLWNGGTGMAVEAYEKTGNLPINNFKGGRFPRFAEIAAQKLLEKGYIEAMDTCYGCPVRCKKRVRIDKPWKVDPIYGGA